MSPSEPKIFSPLAAISVQLKLSWSKFLRFIAEKKISPVSFIVVLGSTSISWLTTAAIAPQQVQAYTANVAVSLNRDAGESYQNFLRRAEAVSRAAAQRSFDTDILVTEVVVTIIGQNNGAIAPVLSLKASRQGWRNRPDPQHWATYLPNAESLLQFEKPQVETATPPPPPAASPTPAAPATTQPAGPRIINIQGTPGRLAVPSNNPTPATAPAPSPPGATPPPTNLTNPPPAPRSNVNPPPSQPQR